MARARHDAPHVPGPATRALGLTVAAALTCGVVTWVVLGHLAWWLMLGSTTAGFVGADLLDALRQQRYWPRFEPLPEVAAPASATQMSGTPAEHAERLALVAAHQPTVTDLGGPPRWMRLVALAYIVLTVALLSGEAWVGSLAALTLGAVARLATPFASASQRRIAEARTSSASRAGARLRGAAAERVVGNTLSTSGAFTHVMHAKMFGTGDADHIVIGPQFALIETKSGGGPLSVRDGELRAGTKTFPTDLTARTAETAAQLTKLGQRPCTPVVCIDGATGRPRQVGGVWVCGLATLVEVLEALPAVAPGGQATTVYNRLTKAHRRAYRRRAAHAVAATSPRWWKARRIRDRLVAAANTQIRITVTRPGADPDSKEGSVS